MRESSGSSYGWVVVAVGALMTCVGFGSMLSLAVFLQPISQDMGWSRSGVSAAAVAGRTSRAKRFGSSARTQLRCQQPVRPRRKQLRSRHFDSSQHSRRSEIRKQNSRADEYLVTH